MTVIYTIRYKMFTILNIVYEYWSSTLERDINVDILYNFMSVQWDVKWCPVARKLQNFTNDHRLLILAAVIWPKYCRYGVKHHIYDQSINPEPHYQN